MGCEETLFGRGEPGVVSDEGCAPRDGGVIMYRRNLSMLLDIPGFAEEGRKIRVIGGVSGLKRLLEAVAALYRGRKTSHPEVGLFESSSDLRVFLNWRPLPGRKMADIGCRRSCRSGSSGATSPGPSGP